MKRIIVFLLLMAVVLSVTGCQMPNPEVVPKDSEPMNMEIGQAGSDYEGIGVQIADAAWGERGLVLEVDWINRTSYEGIFGASFTIERKEGDQWVPCETFREPVFIAIAYILPADETRRESYHVSTFYDVSKAGTYRFRSQISINDGTEKADSCDVWAAFTLGSHEGETQLAPQKIMDYGVQYIRTGGYHEGAQYPRAVLIRSLQELDAYMEANGEKYYLELSGFQDACKKYDEAYFERGYLVFVLVEEGSGSIRHEVAGSSISSDGTLAIHIQRKVPELGTCDMAQWHIILEMSKDVKVKDENSIKVYLDGKLCFDEGSPIVMIQRQPIRTAPPEGELIHGSGSAALFRAGYGWMYAGEDGTMCGVIADSIHPLGCQDYLEPVYVSGEYGKLVFEEMPDSIEIRCWPDTAWDDTDAVSEPVNCDKNVFDYKPGGFIYEITAEWDENEYYYGSANYYVYIVCQ